jgi:sugar lactone lactonase YvrE
MNLEHLKPRTMLTQLGQWDLTPPVDQPRGIAFHEGKLYVTGYESRSLLALDVASGASAPVLPVAAGAPLTYTHPGAVEVGPDGLLYVLNNGERQASLYGMRPDGEVVRQIPLEGKGPIAVGLDLGPDGALYVTDMLGGKILKYSPEGGEPLDAWGGMTDGFNNVMGIVVDEEGTLFAAEQSAGRIQQLDSAGNFVRAYDLRCNPMFMALDGDWLVVSCDNKLVSLNRSTHELRSVQVTGDGLLPNAPTGVTYGPDGTLYVVSGNTVLAYEVQR